MPQPPAIELRVTPRQARARETVDHILEVAAALLAEVGIDGFNTNLLAERAGVRVRSVYRYFPDKVAIIRALAANLARAWDGWFEDAALADPRQDLREVWQGYLTAFVRGVTRHPGGLAIRAALHSLPELRGLEFDNTRQLAARVSRALRARAPALDRKRADVAGVLLLETAIATLDRALSGPARQRQRLLDALVEMQVGYLERLFAPLAQTRVPERTLR